MKEYLSALLSEKLSRESFLWLNESIVKAGQADGELGIYQTFARIPSVTGKEKIDFTAKSLSVASQLRKGWDPSNWRIDQAGRILLLLSLPTINAVEFKSRLGKLFEVADMNELETLCLGLPLYPFPEDLVELARLGLRSNMKSVFEAVTLNNPYPADYFDEDVWNQMILKSLFVESPVYKIIGVDERSNIGLAKMLCDYAHERWAAGRIVNPELWRSVGPFIGNNNFKDIQRVFDNEDELQKQAALLACAKSSHRGALMLLDSNPIFKSKILSKEINWNSLAEDWYKNTELTF